MSSHSTASSTSSRASRARLAGNFLPARRPRSAARSSAVPADGALPRYCERKPLAVLDDGWSGDETFEDLAADAELQALEDSLGGADALEAGEHFHEPSVQSHIEDAGAIERVGLGKAKGDEREGAGNEESRHDVGSQKTAPVGVFA